MIFSENKSIWDARSAFSTAFKDLLDTSRKLHEAFPQKLYAMQEVYLLRHPELYTSEQVEYLQYYLKSVIYKFHLANLSLEQLWSIGDSKRLTALDALENGMDRLDCSDNELLLSSFALEGFLFQGNALLDFYMLFSCLLLRTREKGSMSSKTDFYKELGKVQHEPFAGKAKWLENYFKGNVFAEPDKQRFDDNAWGTLLRSLRDKIAHRDIIRPSFESQETLIRGVLFDWPTLRGMPYDRFCQAMENGMFSLMTEAASYLYELDWKPGPYRPNLW
jgi:hypothetical protein